MVAAARVGPEPVPRKRFTVETLAAAMVQCTESKEIRRRAAAIGATIAAEDGVANAVRALEAVGRV